VHRFERIGHVLDVTNRFVLRQRTAPLHHLLQRVAAQQFHYHVGGVVFGEHRVNIDDVGVVELRQRARFVEKVSRADEYSSALTELDGCTCVPERTQPCGKNSLMATSRRRLLSLAT
jgi:hypothetical protein